MYICIYNVNLTQDMEDVDFTTIKNSLTAHWEGFSHPHLNVTYKFQAGTTPGGADVVSPVEVGTQDSYSASGLSLETFKVLCYDRRINNSLLFPLLFLLKKSSN